MLHATPIRRFCDRCDRVAAHVTVRGRLDRGLVRLDPAVPEILVCTDCAGGNGRRRPTPNSELETVNSQRRRRPGADGYCPSCGHALARDGWATGTGGRTACCKRPKELTAAAAT